MGLTCSIEPSLLAHAEHCRAKLFCERRSLLAKADVHERRASYTPRLKITSTGQSEATRPYTNGFNSC